MDVRPELLFGRYTREECGLPPAPVREPGLGRVLLRTALLTACLLAVGWLAGGMTARWREYWTARLPALVSRAGPAETAALLSRGRAYATALPHRAGMRRDLALAAGIAAERSPRRLGYYGNIRNLGRGDGGAAGLSPEAAFLHALSASGVHADLGDFPATLDSLVQAEQAWETLPDGDARRSWGLLLVNAKAYLLATAPEGAGRDAGRALHLAELMISSKDPLPGGGYASGSAALLDTLAMACHAAGQAGKARSAQSLALGLAESPGLDIYVSHYDEIADDAASPARENDNG